MLFEVVNVLDAIDRMSEGALHKLLDTFSCPKNLGIEHFLQAHAVSCAKQRFAITYLVFNSIAEVVGFFTLAHKPMVINQSKLEGKYRRRIKQFCPHNNNPAWQNENESLLISTFLIAQLAKNSLHLDGDMVSGVELMGFAKGILEDIQKAIGGGVISLECENQPKLLDFYQKQGFRIFGERHSVVTGEFYHQLLQVF